MMFEDRSRSPGSVPRAMFTQPNKRRSVNVACGREGGVEYSNGLHNNVTSVHQSELESRLDTGSSCSLKSTPENALLIDESSLGLGFR